MIPSELLIDQAYENLDLECLSYNKYFCQYYFPIDERKKQYHQVLGE
jgi:hypothetical protein